MFGKVKEEDPERSVGTLRYDALMLRYKLDKVNNELREKKA